MNHLEELENILLKLANDVLDLPKTNYPLGKPIDDARQAINTQILRGKIEELKNMVRVDINPAERIPF
jgi:hypothetical protein